MFSWHSMPVMWNQGSTARCVSPGPWPCRRAAARSSTTMLPWVSSAPLGAPVVPEVYWSRAVSSRRRGSGCVAGGGARGDDAEEVLGARMSLGRGSRKDGGTGRVGGRGGSRGRRSPPTASSGVSARGPARTPPYPASEVIRNARPSPGSSCRSSAALCMGLRHTFTAPALQGAEVGDGELRAVLEEERHAVAGLEPARAQPAGERSLASSSSPNVTSRP